MMPMLVSDLDEKIKESFKTVELQGSQESLAVQQSGQQFGLGEVKIIELEAEIKGSRSRFTL